MGGLAPLLTSLTRVSVCPPVGTTRGLASLRWWWTWVPTPMLSWRLPFQPRLEAPALFAGRSYRSALPPLLRGPLLSSGCSGHAERLIAFLLGPMAGAPHGGKGAQILFLMPSTGTCGVPEGRGMSEGPWTWVLGEGPWGKAGTPASMEQLPVGRGRRAHAHPVSPDPPRGAPGASSSSPSSLAVALASPFTSRNGDPSSPSEPPACAPRPGLALRAPALLPVSTAAQLQREVDDP